MITNIQLPNLSEGEDASIADTLNSAQSVISFLSDVSVEIGKGLSDDGTYGLFIILSAVDKTIGTAQEKLCDS